MFSKEWLWSENYPHKNLPSAPTYFRNPLLHDIEDLQEDGKKLRHVATFISLKWNCSHAYLSYYVCSFMFPFACILNFRHTIPGHTFLQTIYVFGSYKINFCYLASTIPYISNTKSSDQRCSTKKLFLKTSQYC